MEKDIILALYKVYVPMLCFWIFLTISSRLLSNEIMYPIFYGWQYIVLILGIVFFIYETYRTNLKKAFLRWSPLMFYIIHQFEEYGFGYSFQRFLCLRLGYESINECPATPEFIISVNVFLVHSQYILCGLLIEKHPDLTFISNSFAFGNSLLHIIPFIKTGEYNPGLYTAIILLFPLGIFSNPKILKSTFKIRILQIVMGFLQNILMTILISIKNIKIQVSIIGLFQMVNSLIPLTLYLTIKNKKENKQY
jgi:hypothetical protein